MLHTRNIVRSMVYKHNYFANERDDNLFKSKQTKYIENIFIYLIIFLAVLWLFKPAMLRYAYLLSHTKTVLFFALTLIMGVIVHFYNSIGSEDKRITLLKTLILALVHSALYSVSMCLDTYILKLLLGLLILLASFVITSFTRAGEDRDFIFDWSFIAFCFVLYFWLSLFLPYDAGPDEYMRYDIPKFIYEHGTLPHGGDPEIRNIYWGFSYAFTPIAGYIPGALLMRLVSLFSTSDYALLSAARFPSVLFSTGSVYFAYKIAKDILGNKWSKLFILLFALWPEFIFISSYVNLDAMGMFSIMWILYAMLLAKKRKWTVKSCVFLGVGCGICIMSYYNYYTVFLVAIIYSVWELLSDKTIDDKKVFLISRIAIVLFVALIIGGWVFIRNYAIYDGDFLGLETSRIYGEKYAMEQFKPSNRYTPASQGVGWFSFFFQYAWIRHSAESFIATFGYMDIYLDDAFYITTYIIAALSTAYLLSKNTRRLLKQKSKWNKCMILHIMIVLLLGISYSYFFDFQPQGRYILPMLPAMLLLFTYSWMGLTKIKKQWIGYALVSLIGTFLLVQTYVSIFDVILYSYA